MKNITEYFSDGDGHESRMTLHKFNDDLVVSVLPVTIFIGVEAVVGFIGNILILCVYSKWYTRCNFRYFVLCLAVYDFTSCLTTLPGEMFSQFHWYDYKYRWICKTKSYFNVFTAWGSAYTLLLLAFDRYKKICRPLGRQILPSFALKLCACGICLSSIVAIPITILWGTQTYTSIIDGVSLNVSVCEKSETYADDIYPFVYVTCVYILPIGLMMSGTGVLNILIARKLFCKMFIHRLSKEQRDRLKNARMQRNMSISSSDIPEKQSAVLTGIRKILFYTSSVMSVKNFKPGTGHLNTDRQGSQVSLCSISAGDVPRETDGSQSNIQSISLGMTIPSSRSCSSIPCSGTAINAGPPRETNSEGGSLRQRRKTLIMLILTSVFIVTMSLYIALLSLVAERDKILRRLSNSEKAVFFFVWRLYFINSIINPVLYGVMDPRFRAGIKQMLRCQ